jgi:hypothetical protein
MARDIEEFLRKAAERRQQQKQGQVPERQPHRQAPNVSEPPALNRPPLESDIIETAEIVEPRRQTRKKPAKKKRESVAEHVTRYMDNSDIKQKTASLGTQVTQIRDQFDSTVHQHLDHDICSVDDGRESLSTQPALTGGSQLALELKKMLARPETVAQAILVSEILNRPNFEDD